MGLIVLTCHHSYPPVSFLPGLFDGESSGLHLIVFDYVKPQVEGKHFDLDHAVVFPRQRKIGLMGECSNDQSADVAGK
ncbi:MAG: hypothetical protein BWY82_02567 [Verrucomicrobia bacterium ADurb.Bin474]|nr:MAG: hypothetical protein BWY82_02567 [Verrucomicrobia bacterium ADurb.Bin474]